MGGDRDDLKLWRLGVSEYLPKLGHGDARTWARWHFLQVVARRVPEVLMDLQTRSQSTSGKNRNNTPTAFVQYWRLPGWALPYVEATWKFGAKLGEDHPKAKRVYWKDRDNIIGELVQDAPVPSLEVPWQALEDRLRTLKQLAKGRARGAGNISREIAQELTQIGIAALEFTDSPSEASPFRKSDTLPAYDSRLETRRSYLQRVNRYIEAREASVNGDSFTKRPRKDPRAFNWLVDHLVGRKTYADIWKADSSVQSRNTVRNACVELLALLDGDKPAQK